MQYVQRKGALGNSGMGFTTVKYRDTVRSWIHGNAVEDRYSRTDFHGRLWEQGRPGENIFRPVTLVVL